MWILKYRNDLQNFGDELAPYIITKLQEHFQNNFNIIIDNNINYDVIDSVHYKENLLSSIGSIISKGTVLKRKGKIIVWGSGLLNPNFITKHILFSKIKAQIYKNNIKWVALRGPLSQEAISQIIPIKISTYGDPAILLPIFFTPPHHFSQKINYEFRNKTGVILHLKHQNLFNKLKEINKNTDPWKIISIYRKWNIQEKNKGIELENFINEVCSCKQILTTSFHGFVIAQNYNIPVKWLKIDNSPIHTSFDWFKFHDYFLGTNQEIQQPIIIENNLNSIIRLFQSITIEKEPIKTQQALALSRKKLLLSFPKDLLLNL